MEIVDEQVAAETEEVERLVAGDGVGTACESLGRVFGGLPLLEKRRDSVFSEEVGV